MVKKSFLVFIPLFFWNHLYAKEEELVGHIKKGNLALPTSQQPRALFCLGQTILEKNDFIGVLQPLFFKGPQKQTTEIYPFAVWGINSRCSLLLSLPWASKLRYGPAQSRGLEDMLIQLEYAVYQNPQENSGSQISMVGLLGLPTGSNKKNPITGYGSPYVILGATAAYMSEHWYLYASPFLSLTTRKGSTKYGNRVLYQAGIGRNIGNPFGSILTVILETSGFYIQKSTVCGVEVPTSGNVWFAGPSLYFATNRLIVQGGILFPIVQHFTNPIYKNNYFASLGFGFKFAGPKL